MKANYSLPSSGNIPWCYSIYYHVPQCVLFAVLVNLKRRQAFGEYQGLVKSMVNWERWDLIDSGYNALKTIMALFPLNSFL